MRIEDSNLAEKIQDIFLSEYGTFYFLEGVIIGEINEGVIYNWDAALEVIDAAKQHYGEHISVCYISNRINEYSVNPVDWLKFFNANLLNGYAVVSYTKINFANALLEKFFCKTKMQRFANLYTAINWSKQIKFDLEYIAA